MRISDWSSDVCSSDLLTAAGEEVRELATQMETSSLQLETRVFGRDQSVRGLLRVTLTPLLATHLLMPDLTDFARLHRSEEHTSELQSLMRISYAVFCLKKKIKITNLNKQLTMHQTETRINN